MIRPIGRVLTVALANEKPGRTIRPAPAFGNLSRVSVTLPTPEMPTAWAAASPDQRNALARLLFQKVEIEHDRVFDQFLLGTLGS